MTTSLALPRIDRILCALDLEKPILSSLALANLIAERFAATLEVLHAEHGGGGFGSSRGAAGGIDELMASHNAEQRLAELVQGAKGSGAATTRLVMGDPVASILERTDLASSDLVVLGARQRSDLGWQFRDDIARQVAAMAPCATLTVHERDSPSRIEHILVPVDFDAVAMRAVAWAGAFAKVFDAEVQLLHVVSRERSMQRTVDRTERVVRTSSIPSDVSASLAQLAQELTLVGARAKSEVVIASNVVNGITDYNDRGEHDLLVMGLSGPAQSPPRLTRGAVATLRNRMSIPVLSVRDTTPDMLQSASGSGR